jgi:hypothetical protein
MFKNFFIFSISASRRENHLGDGFYICNNSESAKRYGRKSTFGLQPNDPNNFFAILVFKWNKEVKFVGMQWGTGGTFV